MVKSTYKVGFFMKNYHIKIILFTSIITAVITTSILTLTKTLGSTNNIIYTRDELSEIVGEMQSDINISNQFLSSYPVGSIYITSSSIDPNDLGGTWISFGEGRTLVGVGNGTDINGTTQTFVADNSGGEYTHQLSLYEMPVHRHGFFYNDTSGTDWAISLDWSSVSRVRTAGGPGQGIDYEGGDLYHNNIQPYITVYMWERTA